MVCTNPGAGTGLDGQGAVPHGHADAGDGQAEVAGRKGRVAADKAAAWRRCGCDWAGEAAAGQAALNGHRLLQVYDLVSANHEFP